MMAEVAIIQDARRRLVSIGVDIDIAFYMVLVTSPNVRFDFHTRNSPYGR